jgi:hypothetical protein
MSAEYGIFDPPAVSGRKVEILPCREIQGELGKASIA